jgi:hypothetical protein
LVAGIPVHGECPRTTAQGILHGPGELVFSGLVVDVTRTADLGYRATFAVDRVWKGRVTKQFAVYIWELAPETGGFRLNERYVVVAQRLTNPDARRAAGISEADTVAYTQVPCTGKHELGPNIIGDLGNWQPPD